MAVALLGACAKPMTPSEQQYLAQVMETPLEFTMPAHEADAAWGRAQSFIGKHSELKFLVVTDHVMNTYKPRGSEMVFGYSATRTPMQGDDVEIAVQCETGNGYAARKAQRNAHILANYIQTGALPHPELIAR